MLRSCVLALVGGVMLAVVAGCYSEAARIADRLAEKVEVFEAKSGRAASSDEVAMMAAEAEREEREERNRSLRHAGGQAVEGIGAIATGQWISGALLLLGAGATWLGFGRAEKRRLEPKEEQPPSDPPAPPAVVAAGGGSSA